MIKANFSNGLKSGYFHERPFRRKFRVYKIFKRYIDAGETPKDRRDVRNAYDENKNTITRYTKYNIRRMEKAERLRILRTENYTVLCTFTLFFPIKSSSSPPRNYFVLRHEFLFYTQRSLFYVLFTVPLPPALNLFLLFSFASSFSMNATNSKCVCSFADEFKCRSRVENKNLILYTTPNYKH